ncbi:helix-turn-helix domain-containing protein [Streptomyces sp. NPDC087856]|uniref:helix-turn-helix domain-containing protein n=1 Tax=Streptomyces sp. NPDC087856 TaxID=3365811 RepID=UPI00380BE868
MAAKEETPGDPERRTQFADLIRNRRKQLGLGLDAFAQKAIDPVSGTRVTRGWIYRLETGEKVTPPEFEELRALAAAAELPVEALQDAAGSQFHGRDPLVTGSPVSVAYVRKLDRMPPEQRDRLLAFIDTLVPPGEGEDQ